MQQHPITFKGQSLEFFGIWIVNIALSIITLGIYSAWAKVRTKRYFYGNLELDGDRFEYLAVPIQILIGRIIAILVLIAWAFLNNTQPIVSAVLLLAFVAIFPVLAVRNMRFDRRMTAYRSVRFDFVGSYGQAYINLLIKPFCAYLGFAVISVGAVALFQLEMPWLGGILVALALLAGGPLLAAWVFSGIANFIVKNTRYGLLAFDAQLSAKRYFFISLKTGLFTMGLFLFVMVLLSGVAYLGGFITQFSDVPTSKEGWSDALASGAALFIVAFYGVFFLIGYLSNAYYQSQVRNYVFGETRIDNTIQLHSDMRTLPYASVLFSNLLIIIFTLGLGFPWAMVRQARYLASVTALEGELSLDHARDHNKSQDSAIADELSQAFDVDIGIV